MGDEKMKKYPEEKIIAILREVEAGAKVAEICRKYGSVKNFAHIFGWGPA